MCQHGYYDGVDPDIERKVKQRMYQQQRQQEDREYKEHLKEVWSKKDNKTSW